MSALEEQRSLLQAVVENIPVGIVVVDQAGVPHTANAEALQMLGADSIEAPVFSDWREIEVYRLDGSDVELEEWPISRTLASGDVVSGDRYEVVLEGRRTILEISTAPVVAASGERTGALAVLRDVTLRERAERAERDFVTNAAHELQSPLTAIVSAIEVLQAGAKDGPERDVFLAHIEREADRLARLVRALLVLARSQIGLEAPRDELVALRPLLEEIGGGLRVPPGVELKIDCPSDLAVVTNRELVEQAVVNLAENAAKLTDAGRILLSGADAGGGAVEIAVSDTGPGIAAAERSRVFGRFYRAGADATSGFGLGLAIVRAVAHALDGELELDSEVGTGTTIRLRLPKAAAMMST
jgi:PAS domain S-box-containing protein